MATGTPVARIGPNSILQVVAELRHRLGDVRTEALLQAATGRTLDSLPATMVDEREPNALLQALRRAQSHAESLEVMAAAGRRTADYLLANRIPGVVQRALGLLPERLAMRLLFRSITAHAWTFAGSGRFTVRHAAGGSTLTIAGCPMCRGMRAPVPMCTYYAATFETLLQRVIGVRWQVRETECEAAGAPACRFAVSRRA